MKKNPYSTLGVDRNARPEDIRRAYRRRAQETHPDKAPHREEEFKEVRAAYGLLIDKTRREKYDRTGEGEEHAPDDRGALLSELCNLFMQVIDSPGNDGQSLDIVGEVRRALKSHDADMAGQRAERVRKNEKREKTIKRFRKKSGGQENLLVEMVRHQMKVTSAQIENIDQQRAKVKKLLELVDDYAYEVEKGDTVSTSPTTASASAFFAAFSRSQP